MLYLRVLFTFHRVGPRETVFYIKTVPLALPALFTEVFFNYSFNFGLCLIYLFFNYLILPYLSPSSSQNITRCLALFLFESFI